MRWTMRRAAAVAAVAMAMGAGGGLTGTAAQEQPTPPAEQPEPPAEQPTPPPAPEPAAQPPIPAVPVTLGEFAVRVAERLKPQAPGGALAPEAAAWALLQAGIRLRGDLGSNLTEADAVSLLSELGFNVQTKTPSRLVTRDRLDVILTTFVKPVS